MHVIETLKNIQHTESQTYYQKISTITSNKMVQTEYIENNIVATNNNTKIRTVEECLVVFKTQVKLFTFQLNNYSKIL